MPRAVADCASSADRNAESRSRSGGPDPGQSPWRPSVHMTSTVRIVELKRAKVPPVWLASSSGWAWMTINVGGVGDTDIGWLPSSLCAKRGAGYSPPDETRAGTRDGGVWGIFNAPPRSCTANHNVQSSGSIGQECVRLHSAP